MRQAGKKNGQSTFIIFTPKYSKIKDHKKIVNCKAKKAYSLLSITNYMSFQFSDNN